jgi:hypothetical protein
MTERIILPDKTSIAPLNSSHIVPAESLETSKSVSEKFTFFQLLKVTEA